MPARKSAADPKLKVGYVLMMLALTFLSFGLYSAAPWVVALYLNGPVELTDLVRTMIPSPQSAVLANGKLVVPYVEVNLFRPGMVGTTLVAFDLETGESRSVPTQIPPGPMKLVADKTGLWCLNRSTVFRIQDDVVTQTKPVRGVRSFESAFLHEGKLAVPEEATNRGVLSRFPARFDLLVWTGTAWQDEGRILLPRSPETVDATKVSTVSNLASPEVHVLNADGQTHVFCLDGTDMQYSNRLDVIPVGSVSALVVENSVSPIPGWKSIGTQGTFEFGVDTHGPLRLDQGVRQPGNKQWALFRLVDGKWQEIERQVGTAFNLKPSRLVLLRRWYFGASKVTQFAKPQHKTFKTVI